MERIADVVLIVCSSATVLLSALNVMGIISVKWFWAFLPVLSIPIVISVIVAVIIFTQALMGVDDE